MSERRVWVCTMPVGVAAVLIEMGSQILIEQIEDGPPSIALRDNQWAVWGPPVDSVEAL